jgi:DNA polymerase-3 subunit gamma/tau
MGFIVTARKWRPQRFEDVVGQEHITSTLKNAIKNNRIAHAYIFTGPRGVGKTTTARILAKALNCLNPINNEPCNVCELCLSIQNGQSMDIFEIDAASNRGIDEVRTLRESVKYAPSRGKYKIYIIDEVHMLTKESFNAFLKTLEEPPAHTIFIFATTDIHKVPLTIISRCQRFDFRRIQLNTIKSLLAEIATKEKIEIDDKTLTIIAKKADGALRDAESFFDQIVSFCGNKIDPETVSRMLNLIDDEIYFILSDAILQKNFNAVFSVSDNIYNNGYDFIDFINGLIEHFRNILTVILTNKTDLVETAEVYRTRYLNYIGKYNEGDLLRILNFLNKTQQELRFTQNHRLKVEISLSQLIGLYRTTTISEILNRIESSDKNISREPEKKNYNSPELKLQNSDSIIKIIPGTPQVVKNAKEPYSSAKIQLDSTNQTEKPSENVHKTESHSTNIHPAKSLKNESLPGEQIESLFDKIKQNWEGFVNLVVSEKRLTLGPYIGSLKLIGLEGSKIKVWLDDEHGKKSFQFDKEYLTKKTNEIFGKKLTFQFEIKQPGSVFDKKDSSGPIGEKINDDPVIDMIIKELGGEEMSG